MKCSVISTIPETITGWIDTDFDFKLFSSQNLSLFFTLQVKKIQSHQTHQDTLANNEDFDFKMNDNNDLNTEIVGMDGSYYKHLVVYDLSLNFQQQQHSSSLNFSNRWKF